MISLKEKLVSEGISLGSISRASGVSKAAVSSFVNGQYIKCSKSNKNILRLYFISIGLQRAPKPRIPKCVACGATHPSVCRSCGIPSPTKRRVKKQQRIRRGNKK